MCDFSAESTKLHISFSVNVPGAFPLAVTFTNFNIGDTRIIRYRDFGNSIPSKRVHTAIHPFHEADEYNVSLKAENATNCDFRILNLPLFEGITSKKYLSPQDKYIVEFSIKYNWIGKIWDPRKLAFSINPESELICAQVWFFLLLDKYPLSINESHRIEN